MIYGVNDAKIILLKFVFIEAVLIPAFPGTEIVSIITFPILRILLFPSVLELIKFSTVENLFKYSEIFKGRAATKGQTLGTIPSNSKFIEIIGINYADDNNFYYFTPIILRTEIIRNRDIAFTVGITSDTREFVLSFKNNVITITHSTVTNSIADNNFIAQILSVNS